jgi:hypothetical protein
MLNYQRVDRNNIVEVVIWGWWFGFLGIASTYIFYGFFVGFPTVYLWASPQYVDPGAPSR